MTILRANRMTRMPTRPRKGKRPTRPRLKTDVRADAGDVGRRSAVMRAVPSRSTSAEVHVQAAVRRLGFRPRMNDASLPGTPDLVFPARRKAIFVNGCFWHGHTCARGNRVPKSNTPYWLSKVQGNRCRDRRVIRELKQLGWSMLVVWECEISLGSSLERRLKRFLSVSRRRTA